LLHVLSENFGMHDKHKIIAKHDPVQLVEKLKVKHTVDPPLRFRCRRRSRRGFGIRPPAGPRGARAAVRSLALLPLA
jgi:hypothetical protein